jgi:hypothetical protein
MAKAWKKTQGFRKWRYQRGSAKLNQKVEMWDRTSSCENVDDVWLDSEQDAKLIHGGNSVQQAGRTLLTSPNWAHSSTRPLAQKAKNLILRLERGRRAGLDRGLHRRLPNGWFQQSNL